ncbi:MAG: bifunctional folylpolyglutamate synthase/dihydrofolate synthase [Ectothiorhodospiraceae bacterium]|nr:bifunctional folylpolyglutamate synthase/dihydrofolate synthase [Ectothiorhodospiraceae bacterium]
MTYEESLDYLYGLQKVGIKLGLDNVRALLRWMGNPQEAFPAIHVAGTNGKGSTCSFMASILQEAGYRTGLYTSPHLVRFNERIRVNGTAIPDEYLAAQAARIRPFIEERNMTFFEATTAIAFQYFADEGVEIAVIETGLGGRLDATNILDPELSVITPLSLEHTEYLGNTIEEIAREKGGIIKPGKPLVMSDQPATAMDELFVIAQERGSPYRTAPNPEAIALRDIDRMKFVLSYGGDSLDVESPLIGVYQAQNAQTAATALEMLDRDRFRIGAAHIRTGIRNVRRNTGINGRLIRISANPELVFDTAHNPAGVSALLELWTALREPGKTHILMGFLKTKDVRTIAAAVLTHRWASIGVTRGTSPEFRSPNELKAQFQSSETVVAHEDAAAALETLRTAIAPDESILVFGSHYLIGEFLARSEIERK